MITSFVQISTTDLNQIRSLLSSGHNFYRAYDVIAASSELDSSRSFWFTQASVVNRMANGLPVDPNFDSSGRFILDYWTYGLAIDGKTSDLTVTSNKIVTNVINSIHADAA